VPVVRSGKKGLSENDLPRGESTPKNRAKEGDGGGVFSRRKKMRGASCSIRSKRGRESDILTRIVSSH